jgi:hypothetical protein
MPDAPNIVPLVLSVLVALGGLAYLLPIVWDANPLRRLAVFLLGYVWLGTVMVVMAHASRVGLGVSLQRADWSLATAGFLAWVLVLSGLTWRLAHRRDRTSATLVLLVLGLFVLGFLGAAAIQLALSEPGGWAVVALVVPLSLAGMAFLLRWAIRDWRRDHPRIRKHRDQVP